MKDFADVPEYMIYRWMTMYRRGIHHEYVYVTDDIVPMCRKAKEEGFIYLESCHYGDYKYKLTKDAEEYILFKLL